MTKDEGMLDNKNKLKGVSSKMADYVFKIKKGEIEIEISSDDSKFIEEELSKWREDILRLQNEKA